MSEIEERACAAPQVGPRGIAALRGTRPWAVFVSIVALILAALRIVQVFFLSVGTSSVPPTAKAQHLMAWDSGFAIAGVVVGVVVSCLFAWFALQYGRGIKACLEHGSGERLEEALWWQRRYWTLQGVVAIIGVVVVVLGVIAAIAIPLIVGHGYGGYRG